LGIERLLIPKAQWSTKTHIGLLDASLADLALPLDGTPKLPIYIEREMSLDFPQPPCLDFGKREVGSLKIRGTFIKT